jgi:lysozyme family protein
MIEEIITDVLRAEGWDKYTNHPADKGGPTKWGITQAAWSEALKRPATPEDVKAITEREARVFYRTRYVIDPNFHRLAQPLAALVVDCGVNHGVTRASKWLQKVVGAKADGIVGPKTLAAVAEIPWEITYLRICAHRVRFYGEIVRRDRTQAVFIAGWNNRAAKFIDRIADYMTDG